MAKQVWNSRAFPLLDRLNIAMHAFQFKDALAFSGTAVGLDMDKLAYFGASLFWRVGIHSWNIGVGGRTKKLQLGDWEEKLRMFLLGEASFPTDLVLMATVCNDRASIESFMTPVHVMEECPDSESLS